MNLNTVFFDWMTMIQEPWHWAVSGVAIAAVMALMTWMGRSFGVSSSFKVLCTIAGAGKKHEFFRMDWRSEGWRLAFVVGAVGGGYLASQYLLSPDPVAISSSTLAHLQQDWGINYPEGHGFWPESLFHFSSLSGVMLSIVGGFLVGFGARYGNGCTSGHAITGLSHLQLPSLITVMGFFIGGLLMTWVIMPLLFS